MIVKPNRHISYTKEPLELDLLQVDEYGNIKVLGVLRKAYTDNMSENIKPVYNLEFIKGTNWMNIDSQCYYNSIGIIECTEKGFLENNLLSNIGDIDLLIDSCDINSNILNKIN